MGGGRDITCDVTPLRTTHGFHDQGGVVTYLYIGGYHPPPKGWAVPPCGAHERAPHYRARARA